MFFLCKWHHFRAPFQAGKLFSPAPIIQTSSCLSKHSLSLSLLLKCPVVYAKQCHMSHCQYFGQAPLVCLKGSCACWPCQCPLAQKSHHHRVTESQMQRNYSQARSFSPQGHIHSQTHSLKSSSFTRVNSELKLFSWITEIYNGRFVNEKRMSNVNSQRIVSIRVGKSISITHCQGSLRWCFLHGFTL